MLRVTIVLAVLAAARAVSEINGIDCAILDQIFDDKCDTSTTTGPVPKPRQAISLTNGYTACQTSDGTAGFCVTYNLCDAYGEGVIDIRASVGDCPSYKETCCVPSDIRDPSHPITPDKEPERQGCGWRNPDGVGFHTTGNIDGESKFGEFPWMVGILKIEPVDEDDPDGQKLIVYVSGGSLIHPGVVLTGAVKVANSTKLRVRAGEWDTLTDKEIYPYQEKTVSSVVVHQDFNPRNLVYDIAILFLSSPMQLAPNVGVVCLPPPGVRVHGGAQCLASGWGKDKFGNEGNYQIKLKKVELPVVERYQCQTALRKTRLGRLFRLHTSFMCAGGELGKDTCTGDGGSPLVCPIKSEKDRYMQSGFVAWGIGCGDDGTPGVYVDVSHLREWIDDKIVSRGLDPAVYTI